MKNTIKYITPVLLAAAVGSANAATIVYDFDAGDGVASSDFGFGVTSGDFPKNWQFFNSPGQSFVIILCLEI